MVGVLNNLLLKTSVGYFLFFNRFIGDIFLVDVGRERGEVNMYKLSDTLLLKGDDADYDEDNERERVADDDGVILSSCHDCNKLSLYTLSDTRQEVIFVPVKVSHDVSIISEVAL